MHDDGWRARSSIELVMAARKNDSSSIVRSLPSRRSRTGPGIPTSTPRRSSSRRGRRPGVSMPDFPPTIRRDRRLLGGPGWLSGRPCCSSRTWGCRRRSGLPAPPPLPAGPPARSALGNGEEHLAALGQLIAAAPANVSQPPSPAACHRSPLALARVFGRVRPSGELAEGYGHAGNLAVHA